MKSVNSINMLYDMKSLEITNTGFCLLVLYVELKIRIFSKRRLALIARSIANVLFAELINPVDL